MIYADLLYVWAFRFIAHYTKLLIGVKRNTCLADIDAQAQERMENTGVCKGSDLYISKKAAERNLCRNFFEKALFVTRRSDVYYITGGRSLWQNTEQYRLGS